MVYASLKLSASSKDSWAFECQTEPPSLRRNSTAACHAASKVAYDLGKRPRALSTAMTNIGFQSHKEQESLRKVRANLSKL
jgi:hypothetical protein